MCPRQTHSSSDRAPLAGRSGHAAFRSHMRLKRISLVAFLAGLAIADTALAQFGHPLKGSWSGDWGTSKQDRQRVLLDLSWDGKAISGTINPGPEAVPMTTATLDPANWTVRFEANRKDGSGATTRYLIEGTLQNIGSQYRVITGTWSQGARKGDFKVTRN